MFSLQYFLGKGYRRVPSAGIFLSTKIVDRRKKWDTDNWDCNKTVLLSVAVDAVVTIWCVRVCFHGFKKMSQEQQNKRKGNIKCLFPCWWCWEVKMIVVQHVKTHIHLKSNLFWYKRKMYHCTTIGRRLSCNCSYFHLSFLNHTFELQSPMTNVPCADHFLLFHWTWAKRLISIVLSAFVRKIPAPSASCMR